MMLRSVAAIGIVIATCAAFRPYAPFRPVGTIGPVSSFQAPAMWVEQYHAAERCTGIKGDVTRVKWQIAPGTFFTSPQGEQVIGFWDKETHTITIASAFANHPWVIRHESIHDLIGGGHPQIPIQTPCNATWGFLLDPDPWAAASK